MASLARITESDDCITIDIDSDVNIATGEDLPISGEKEVVNDRDVSNVSKEDEQENKSEAVTIPGDEKGICAEIEREEEITAVNSDKTEALRYHRDRAFTTTLGHRDHEIGHTVINDKDVPNVSKEENESEAVTISDGEKGICAVINDRSVSDVSREDEQENESEAVTIFYDEKGIHAEIEREEADEETTAVSSDKMEALRCQYCDKAFTTTLGHRVHELGHTEVLNDRDVSSLSKEDEQENESEAVTISDDEKEICAEIEQEAETTVVDSDKTEALRCQYCDKAFTTTLGHRVHELGHTGESLYECHVCGQLFYSQTSCDEHKIVHARKRFHCVFCKNVFARRHSRDWHELSHSNVSSSTCRLCGQVFPDDYFALYQEGCSPENKTCRPCEQASTPSEKPVRDTSIKCKYCNQIFASVQEKDDHEKTHDPERPYQCKLCPKAYTSKSGLEVHMRIHRGEKPFKCQFCDRTFTTKYTCQIHERLHTGEKPYLCNICHRAFLDSGTLRSHKMTHIDKSLRKVFKCTLCPKKYVEKNQLRRHILGVHIDGPSKGKEKRHQCQTCSKYVGSQSALRIHTRLHTGEKPYHCTYCQRSFSTNPILTRHIRTHTGEKPFPCSFCEKRFACRNSHLLHERTHTGEKPHNCKFCSKAFAAYQNCKEHERTHTGERRFKCKHCDKGFMRKKACLLHENRHKMSQNEDEHASQTGGDDA